MPYTVGPQDGPHEQGFRSVYFSGTASSGLMMEWRFNDGAVSGTSPLATSPASQQGWYVEKTKLDPIMTCFAGVAYSAWNDKVLEASRTHLIISSGLCPEIYVDTRTIGSLPGNAILAGSKLVNTPSWLITGVDDGYAFPNDFLAGNPGYWQQMFPAHHMVISLGTQAASATGTVKGWVVRH